MVLFGTQLRLIGGFWFVFGISQASVSERIETENMAIHELYVSEGTAVRPAACGAAWVRCACRFYVRLTPDMQGCSYSWAEKTSLSRPAPLALFFYVCAAAAELANATRVTV
eukprot:175577-Chlamydomonas_euryale.AAC.2